MPSFSFHCDVHDVCQPHTIQEIQYPIPRFVQLEVTISLDILFSRHDRETGHFTDSGTHSAQETLRFNHHVLKYPNQAYRILAPMLKRLLIYPTSPVFDVVIDKIIQHGLRIGNWQCNMGRKVLPLRAELRGRVVRHVDDESDLIRRALVESASQSQSSHGMVPTKDSSVKKLLKRVRVEEGKDQCEKVKERIKKRKVKGEDCVICLAELKIGSCATQMPCSHILHSNCIKKWLKQSHYCPICRFEMPT